ncbi:hypothetical protein CR513_03658, partial [Mucuna pruriens]
MSLYQIVFGKAYHLLVEIKHRAYWTIKKCNMAYDSCSCRNWRNYAWKLTRTPRSTRRRILRKEFKVGQKLLLFNSRLKLIVNKLRSKWDKDEAINRNFKVNGHQLKPYYEGSTLIVGEVETISLMEPTILDDTL